MIPHKRKLENIFNFLERERERERERESKLLQVEN